MVQVIGEAAPKRPSFAQRLNAGVGQGLQALGDYADRSAQNEQMQRQKKQLSQLTGMDLSEVNDPKILEKAFEMFAQGQNQSRLEQLKQGGRSDRDQQKQGFLNQLFDSENKQVQQVNESEKEKQSDAQKLGKKKVPYSNENILKATAVDPNIAREMRAENEAVLREQRENQKSSEAQNAALRAETLPLKQEIYQKAQSAREGIQNKERLIDIIEKGDVNDPTYAIAAELLPFNLGKRLLSDDTVEYKSGLIDEYKDLRTIFKGATRVKEIELLEQKTADIYLNDSQKKAILNSRINALKMDLIREEAAAEMEAEGINYPLLQYGVEIEKRAKPKMDALFNRVIDEQKAVIQDAENQKKIPLDFDDPEGRQVLEQIMKEARGDRNKAREIAKKKGYTIGK